jgi:hypothetical protein
MTTQPAPAEQVTCASCGMPIETGLYCAHCVDADGNLQAFDDRFARMVAWQARRDPGADRAQLEAATLAYLSTMPAWRDAPQVVAARRTRAAADGVTG